MCQHFIFDYQLCNDNRGNHIQGQTMACVGTGRSVMSEVPSRKDSGILKYVSVTSSIL